MNSLRLTDEELPALPKKTVLFNTRNRDGDPMQITGYNESHMLDYARAAIDAQLAKLREQKPVAWCSLTKSGTIGYFDGKPMIMPGPVGNEHHDVALFAAPVLGGQDERIKMLEEIAREKHAAAMHALTVRMDLEDSIARLKVALRFYADVADYKAPFTSGMGKLWHDCGDTARRALASQDENKEPQG